MNTGDSCGISLKSPKHAVMLGVSYMPLEFDAGDSDDRQMKQLDDRDASAFLNLSYRYTGEWASLGQDFRRHSGREQRHSR